MRGKKMCHVCCKLKPLTDQTFYKMRKDIGGFWDVCILCHTNAEIKRTRKMTVYYREHNLISLAHVPNIKLKYKEKDAYPDSYYSHMMGLKVQDCPPELIEVKRLQLKMNRLCKTSKS